MRARDVAYAFVNLFKDEDEGITNLKLQKLLYFAQGFSYQRFDLPLFDDDIEAWDNGPVVYEVYKRYQSCGSEPIRVYESVSLSPENERLILDVAREYGQYTSTKLVGMTHRDGSPWRKIYSHGEMRNVIPKKLIEDHFKSSEPILKEFDFSEIYNDAELVDLTKNDTISLEDWVYE